MVGSVRLLTGAGRAHGKLRRTRSALPTLYTKTRGKDLEEETPQKGEPLLQAKFIAPCRPHPGTFSCSEAFFRPEPFSLGDPSRDDGRSTGARRCAEPFRENSVQGQRISPPVDDDKGYSPFRL